MTQIAVETRRLSKIYGTGRSAVAALADVDLQIEPGEMTAIMGPSGSGKTTLLNLIGALDRPTAGEIFVDGEEITVMPESQLFRVRRYKMGFVFQAFYLVPTLTALENILLPAMPLGLDSRLKQRAADILALLGLERQAKRLPSELSAGEQQRIALARALMLDPPLVLADEPTGNLDSRTGQEILALMQRLGSEQGKTFLIVTHDPRIARVSHRVIYLRDGQLADEPTVDLALDEPEARAA
ncbi:MAG: ABC transporter ATP-binding protein [Chloroflexi bacterium]|nr:ABC transporter ATP-binding protein [Chloroflexota bacterium]